MVKHGIEFWRAHRGVETDKLSTGERAADWLKHWFGTWTALFGVGAVIFVWVLLQRTGAKWDPYPFILLNLCLSCLAAVQGIILQISANRGDRISGQVALHTQTNTDDLMAINQTQLEILSVLKDLQEQRGTVKVTPLATALEKPAAARRTRRKPTSEATEQ